MTRKEMLVASLTAAQDALARAAEFVKQHADDALSGNDFAEYDEVNRNDVGRLDEMLHEAMDCLKGAELRITEGGTECFGVDSPYTIGCLKEAWPGL